MKPLFFFMILYPCSHLPFLDFIIVLLRNALKDLKTAMRDRLKIVRQRLQVLLIEIIMRIRWTKNITVDSRMHTCFRRKRVRWRRKREWDEHEEREGGENRAFEIMLTYKKGAQLNRMRERFRKEEEQIDDAGI